MSIVIDETLKEFIGSELNSIDSDKGKVAEEKIRIRIEINDLFKVDCLKRTEEQKEKLNFYKSIIMSCLNNMAYCARKSDQYFNYWETLEKGLEKKASV